MTNKKYKVNYDPTLAFSESTNTCKFCLRLVYFDSQHVNDYGVPIPHDRPVKEYRNLEKVPHHANHCPDLTGTAEDKIYYKKLREAQGRPDPYYKTTIDVSKNSIDIKQETKDPENNIGNIIEPDRTDPKLDPKKAYYINSATGKRISLEEMDEAIKTLQVKFEVLTASFNDYVSLTAKAIQGFLNDVHNNMSNKERIEARAEYLVESTNNIVIDAKKLDSLTDRDKTKIDKYFKEAE
jgi:archaellum component FlaC